MKYYLLLYIWLLAAATSAYAQNAVPDSSRQRLADKVWLRHIIFEGNKKTKKGVLLREMSIGENDSLQKHDLETLIDINKKRLLNLTLFSEVIFLTQVVNDSTIDWVIKVREQWFIIPEFTLKLADRNFNVWWNEQNRDIRRANLGVMLKHRNFRGNMEQLSATVQIGYTQKFGLEYFKPYIDKNQQHGLGASFFFAQNEETFYTTDSNKLRFVKKPGKYIIRQFEAAALYVLRPAYANKHTVEFRYRDFKVEDTIIQLNRDYYKDGSRSLQLMELTYRYDLNRVDNWNYPMTGWKVVGYAGARIGIKGIGFQSYAMGEVGYFKKLGRTKFYFAEVLRGRLGVPKDPPYAFRYAMGSNSEYVRGYEYYVIDGTHYGVLRTNLKYELINKTIRLPFRYLSVIPFRIYPKVFADVGYVHNSIPGNSFLNNRPLYSGGFGLDFVSTYEFKFRVEYTWNHLGQKGLYLHINSE